MTPRRRAFALAELVTLVLVAAAVAAMLVLCARENRRQGRLGEDMGKLERTGALTRQFASDNEDKFWTFTWKKGQSLSQWPALNNAPTDIQAAANQAVDILRRRAGRLDIQPVFGWVPHILYSHLPLLDYAGDVPDETFISAADTHRLKWSRDPFGFDMGVYQPMPGSPGSNDTKRWAYSASFQLPACFFDLGAAPNRLSQAGTHSSTFIPGPAIFGATTLAEVAHPSHKVHQHDSHARHFGTKQPYCTHDQARLPLLFVDGHVAVHGAVESNGGWNPNSPANAFPTQFQYTPAIWEPGTFTGFSAEPVTGRFRWTRGTTTENGHAGRDFTGPETCSGQSGCP